MLSYNSYSNVLQLLCAVKMTCNLASFLDSMWCIGTCITSNLGTKKCIWQSILFYDWWILLIVVTTIFACYVIDSIALNILYNLKRVSAGTVKQICSFNYINTGTLWLRNFSTQLTVSQPNMQKVYWYQTNMMLIIKYIILILKWTSPVCQTNIDQTYNDYIALQIKGVYLYTYNREVHNWFNSEF